MDFILSNRMTLTLPQVAAEITPAESASRVLENGLRQQMRVWARYLTPAKANAHILDVAAEANLLLSPSVVLLLTLSTLLSYSWKSAGAVADMRKSFLLKIGDNFSSLFLPFHREDAWGRIIPTGSPKAFAIPTDILLFALTSEVRPIWCETARPICRRGTLWLDFDAIYGPFCISVGLITWVFASIRRRPEHARSLAA